ncbi:hypothetical protein RJ640_029424 [Escallonia rubra]|uniref:Uncharacterized protein n=1 Tax=Escallonia rubra TaxID=112253 RepID=A0AA88RWQ1_9ASTE|nr:hypothetical protein RJ640_029424 [Escallonia rubra]
MMKQSIDLFVACPVFGDLQRIKLVERENGVVMFLAILTFRYEERDFNKGLPRMLFTGITSLFISIASMLISFCAGHFFVIKDNLGNMALVIYAFMCFPLLSFAMAQYPLYCSFIWAIFKSLG